MLVERGGGCRAQGWGGERAGLMTANGVMSPMVHFVGRVCTDTNTLDSVFCFVFK